jgi:hypothetical protein
LNKEIKSSEYVFSNTARQFSTQPKDDLNIEKIKDKKQEINDTHIFELLDILRGKNNGNGLISYIDNPEKINLFTPPVIAKSFWILLRNKEYTTIIKNVELLPDNLINLSVVHTSIISYGKLHKVNKARQLISKYMKNVDDNENRGFERCTTLTVEYLLQAYCDADR